jgi:hypothetical protein
MSVHAINHLGEAHATAIPGRNRLHEETGSPHPESAQTRRPAHRLAATENKTDAPAPEAAQDSEKARGVLRLLEAGHFKGVADVRLRINFFEQLSANAASQGASTAQSLVSDLVETVNGRINESIRPLGDGENKAQVIEDLRSGFESAAQAHVGDFASGEGIDVDGLAEAIQSSFDALVDGLRQALTKPDSTEVTGEATDDALDAAHILREAPEEVSSRATVGARAHADVATDDTVVEPQHMEGEDDPNAALEAALASLVGAFEPLLAQLIDSVRDVLQLPDPSPPSGNGAAYDKFLAIYNGLRGVAPEVDDVG